MVITYQDLMNAWDNAAEFGPRQQAVWNKLYAHAEQDLEYEHQVALQFAFNY